MDIQLIGRVLMGLVGLVVVLKVVLRSTGLDWRQYTLGLSLGVLLSGVGTFGMPFMEPYKDYFEAITRLTSPASTNTYGEFFEQVADGSLPESVAIAGIAYALERPVEGMNASLDLAIANAKNGGQRELLMNAKEDLLAKEKVARDLVEIASESGSKLVPKIQQYDPAMQRYIAKSIEELPRERRDRLGIDQRQLENFSKAGR